MKLTDFLIADEEPESRFNSKRKGNANERKLAHILSKWTGKKFVRVPQSGGLEWFKGSYGSGDIICADLEFNKRFNFNIETKHYRNFEIKPELRKNSRIIKWFAQSERDAMQSGKNKIPLLIVRYNYHDYILFCKKRLSKLSYICKYDEDIFGYLLKDIINKYSVNEFIKDFKYEKD